jgi:hypothetical protein
MDGNNDEADMAALMGFSTFSEVQKPKRRKLDADTENSHPTTEPKEDGKSTELSKSLPLSSKSPQNPNDQSISTQPNRPHTFNQPHHGRGSRGGRERGGRGNQHRGNQKDDRPYYPSEETDGAHPVLSKRTDELTPQDLYLLRGGVRDEEGRIVFFNKGMIEDPWNKTQKTVGSTAGGGGIEGDDNARG